MKLTRTVKISYLIGIALLVVGLTLSFYTVSLAEWESPNAFFNMPPETWTAEFREKAETFISPYQNLGLMIMFFGVGIFVLTPTIASQIVSEAKT